MSSINRKVQFSICTFIMAAFLGCATTPAPRPEKYYPKLPSGITTVEAAKEDLSAHLKATIKYGETYYKSPVQDVEGKKKYIRERISRLDWASFQVDDIYGEMTIWTRSIPVNGDRIGIPFFPLFYEDLLEFDIVLDNDEIKLPSGVRLGFSNAEGQRVADDLFFIQQVLKKKQDEQLTLFESQAAQYRALKVKPTISEEQRRLTVQANAVNNQKDYTAAIDLYKKAIELDPVSYPEAYFKTALLYAQLQKFNNAIFIMKQYLMLEPEAQDARSAQDKIYEWEYMVEKKRKN